MLDIVKFFIAFLKIITTIIIVIVLFTSKICFYIIVGE